MRAAIWSAGKKSKTIICIKERKWEPVLPFFIYKISVFKKQYMVYNENNVSLRINRKCGFCEREKGQRRKADMNYDEFLKKNEEVENLSAEDQKKFYETCLREEKDTSAVKVHASYCYAALYFWEGDFRKAIDVVEPIVIEYQSFPYSEILLGCFNLLATAMQCEKEFIEAQFVYELALQVAKEHKTEGLYAREYNNIASIYVMEKRYEQALRYLELAQEAMPYSDVPMGAYIFLNKSIAYRRLNRLQDAAQAYDTAINDYAAEDILPYDTLLCGVSLYYRLGDRKKYEVVRQQALERLKDMHASEIIETCENLLECGMDDNDEALVETVFTTMKKYMQKHPKDLKVGLSMADLQYRYAEKKDDHEAMLKALQLEKYYQDKIIEQTEDDRVSSMAKNIQITGELQKAIESKDKASQAKTNFLNSMSHDIRTPLNALLGYSKLMRKELTDPQPTNAELQQEQTNSELLSKKLPAPANQKLLRYQQMIEQSGDLLLSIINNVLDMGRIESGKMELDENCVMVDDMTEEIYGVFEAEAKKKNLRFVFETHINHKYLMCDQTKVKEIFVNLLSNAVKYTQAGGTVTLYSEEIPCEKEGYVCIKTQVADTGIGMSKEYLPKLFDAFTRERNTTIGKVAGTGLGMPIVKKMVDMMGGTIEVESEVGKGTTFTVILPHKIAEEGYYEQRTERTLDENSRNHISGKRVLLAEDNELNTEIAEAILKDMGLVVDHVWDGIQCVAALEQKPAGTYDLIFMDIQMPNMDGYKATQTIRQFQDKKKADIPIVAMTANAFMEDKKLALEKGMNGHVGKPIDEKKIEEVLLSIFQ